MIDDPYKVLGVPQNATQDEIKKAYRQKAKQYHPDLHPNDPVAAKKMVEVNEAYDMLTHPEKYAAKKAQQQQSSPNGSGGQQYGGQARQQQSGYQDPSGWSSDPGGFDFGDIFGFGFAGEGQSDTRPKQQPGDSPDIVRAIHAINAGQPQEAIRILTYIPSTGRNARWFYLSALANHGAGNTVQANDHIQRALQMEPNNRVYAQVQRTFRQQSQRYEHHAQGFDMQAVDLHKLCLGLCAFNMCCRCNPYRCI